MALRGEMHCNLRKQEQIEKHIIHNKSWIKHRKSRKKNLMEHNRSVFGEAAMQRHSCWGDRNQTRGGLHGDAFKWSGGFICALRGKKMRYNERLSYNSHNTVKCY